MVVNLRPHQTKAVEELKNGSILVGGVGTGKSITAVAYFVTKVCKGTIDDYGSMRTPKDLYIITTAKKRDSLDWEKECAAFGLGREPEHSRSGIRVTVDSWNNVAKYTDVKDAFVVFDEQRVVGSGAWAKSLIKIAKSNEWILLSATPGDTWLDYIPVFVANGFYKNRTEFKREHVVYAAHSKFPKVERYLATDKLERLRRQILVDMPYERHTKRYGKVVKVDYDKELYKKVVEKRWHVYEERPLRDVAELFSVMRRVANSDSSRIEALKDVLAKHPKVIVFYNFNYELEMLRNLGTAIMSSTSGSSTKSLCSCDDLITQGHWTTDEGDGEMWIPCPEHGSSSASTYRPYKCPNCGSLSCDGAKEIGGVCVSRLRTDNQRSGSFAIAEWNGHKHEEIPQTDSWLYLVQYTAGSEGWNCIETDATVFFSLTYSFKQFEQAHGRIDRMNTPFNELFYYYFKGDSTIDKAVWRALREKRNFNVKELGSM